MENHVVHAKGKDGKPTGDPLYSGDETGANAFAKLHDGVVTKLETPEPEAKPAA